MAVSYEPCHDHDEWVQLTDAEIKFACDRAREKYRNDGQHDKHGWEGWNRKNNGVRQGWRNQCLGAVTEHAAGKHLHIYPLHGFNERFSQESDLPFGIEVKLIGLDHYGLRVYPRVPDHFWVVGVVVLEGHEREPYRLPGCFPAWAAKRSEWMKDPHGLPPFYAVPQRELFPLDAVRRHIGLSLMWGMT